MYFSVFFKNTLWLAFIKILKSTLISIILQITDIIFFLIKLLCLVENFKAIASEPFELELVRVRKSYFPKKKLFFRWGAVAFKILHACCSQSTIKEMRVQKSRNSCFVLYQQCWIEWNVLHIKKMLKVGKKHKAIIC